jgi:hypothetical protein
MNISSLGFFLLQWKGALCLASLDPIGDQFARRLAITRRISS